MGSIGSAILVALAVAHVAQAQTVQRTKRGDTTAIVSQGNGKWGPARDAVEVLRVPGNTKETTFGGAYMLQATPDGGVVVFDARGEEGMILRQFDANGKFVRNLGRQGLGPGEYMRPNATLAVHPNGSIYLRDDDKSVSVFGPNGKLTHTFALNFNNGSTNEIYAAPDGSVYVRAAVAPGRSMERPLFHYSLAGKLLDSVSVTARWLPEKAPGSQAWKVLRDRRVIVTRTDKLGFLVIDPPGSRGARAPRALLIGEVQTAAVAYQRREREELIVARNLYLDKCGGAAARGGRPTDRVIVPENKLPASYSMVDLDNRIWIAKATTAQRVEPKVIATCSDRQRGSFKAEVSYEEPPVFAAFQPDGTYLGEVRFPMRARVTFVGNIAWALVPDADDVLTLVKYRIY